MIISKRELLKTIRTEMRQNYCNQRPAELLRGAADMLDYARREEDWNAALIAELVVRYVNELAIFRRNQSGFLGIVKGRAKMLLELMRAWEGKPPIKQQERKL